MSEDASLTIQIENGLGSSAVLVVNEAPVKPQTTTAYRMAPNDAVTIERQGGIVKISIPNAVQSEPGEPPTEGMCACISSGLAFTITPMVSMNITIQSGYLPPDRIGVRCGDGF